MYKYFGIALLGIFATMLIPVGGESTQGSTFYGIAHVTTFDSLGVPTSTQTVHNDLIDEGENFIIQQVFQEGKGSVVAESAQIASICLTENTQYADPVSAVNNTQTVAGFDLLDGISAATNCIEDPAVAQGGTNGFGVAVIAQGTTFDAGTHADQDEEITAIGICSAHASALEFNTCAAAACGSAVLFAIVDITDFTLGSGESATITYTFDVDEEA